MGDSMKKIVVLYFSGVISTKAVSQKINTELKKHCTTEIFSIEKLPPNFNIEGYHACVLGFPTYHAHPPQIMLDFINSLKRLEKPMPAYIFTTCGWCSANTLRIFAKYCVKKNIIPVLHRSFNGCPAADGSLIAPFIKRFFRFSRNLDKTILLDVNSFYNKAEDTKLNIPRLKLYSILNYPNKVGGRLITLKIFVHTDKCTKCGKCVRNCFANALKTNDNDYPVFIRKKCEECYRCIHYCPTLALSLRKRKTPSRTLIKGKEDPRL